MLPESLWAVQLRSEEPAEKPAKSVFHRFRR